MITIANGFLTYEWDREGNPTKWIYLPKFFGTCGLIILALLASIGITKWSQAVKANDIRVLSAMEVQR